MSGAEAAETKFSAFRRRISIVAIFAALACVGFVLSIMKGSVESPAWQSIPAIQQGKLYYLPQDLFLLSPGLHYPEAFEMMAKLIYPEVFP